MSSTQMFVIKRNGTQQPMKYDNITDRMNKLVKPNEFGKVDTARITQKVIQSIINGITTTEIDKQCAEVCAHLSSEHPFYNTLAGRILVSNLHKNTSNHFVDKMIKIQSKLNKSNEKWFNWIKKHKKELNAMVDYERDYYFDYFGFKTLERAYLLKIKTTGNEDDDKVSNEFIIEDNIEFDDTINNQNENEETDETPTEKYEIVERPQDMLLRVASFLSNYDIDETKKTYDLLSNKFYTHATPTLLNSADVRAQLSSCYLLKMEDDLDSILELIKSTGKISKWGGGLGMGIQNIRANGSLIKGTNGPSSGLVPMIQVFNSLIRYVDQGGKRKGSMAMYLEPWHADIMDVLLLKNNTGDSSLRARDLFFAVTLSDLFMRKVKENRYWYLFCPNTAPGLRETWGEEHEKLYIKYVKEKKYIRKVKARDIFDEIIKQQIETGGPYILYKDAVNKKSNHQNLGTISSSNLCIEIVEYHDSKEHAVCNLASIAINAFITPFQQKDKFTVYFKAGCKNSNLCSQFLKNNKFNFEEKNGILEKGIGVKLPLVCYGDKEIGGFDELYNFIKGTFDYNKLEEVAYLVTTKLNTIIDLNYYPTNETKLSNMKHRPIGVGIQGLADALVMLKINFESEESIEFNKKIMNSIYYGCVKASIDLAKGRHDKMKQLIEAKVIIPEFYSEKHNLADKELNKLYHELTPCKYEIERNTTAYGSYSSFDGSPFSRGILQFDMWNVTPLEKEKWDLLKKDLVIYGTRNSLLTALMPTASTSQILGNNECFEFFTNNIYSRRTLAGPFKCVNKYLVEDLISIGLWSNTMKDLIISYKGSIAEINVIPSIIKKLYPTMWEIKQIWTCKNALARAPYVDQTQSMNIFMAKPEYQKIYSLHMWAWENGLKTGMYYLRTRPAEDAIQVTIDPNIQKLNIQLEDDNKKSFEKRFKKPEDGEICESCSA